MKAKRRRHEPEFKARVALEALKGVQTVQQIAKEFDIHPMQVTDWKKAMTAGASGVFGPGRAKAEAEDFERQHETPFSPPSGPPQRLFHEPPAESKFLAAPLKATASERH